MLNAVNTLNLIQITTLTLSITQLIKLINMKQNIAD